eukprot:scpid2290/ scgid7347/ Laminin-like protein epi-1
MARKECFVLLLLAVLRWTPVVHTQSMEKFPQPHTGAPVGKPITATKTCGVAANGQLVTDTLCPMSMVAAGGDGSGLFCFNCSGGENTYSILNAADEDSDTFWASPPLPTDVASQSVNITIDLCQEYSIVSIGLGSGPTLRPSAWALERSSDFGSTYSPWGYYVEYESDCQAVFGVSPSTDGVATEDNSVLCLPESLLTKPDDSVVHANVLEKRPGLQGQAPASRALSLANWARATNIRLRFLRWAGAEEDGTGDASGIVGNFYSIAQINFTGSCECNGHAESCDNQRISSPVEGYSCSSKYVCQCEHNACGDSCQSCCPGFQQREWRISTDSDPFRCEACQCFGHSSTCSYNATVNELGLSMDIHGQRSGGGVCSNCANNTSGVNCERCQPGFYRPEGESPHGACIACSCDATGSIGQCNPENGKCQCKSNVAGDRCDRCKPGYYSFGSHSTAVCQACECHPDRTIGHILTCNQETGQCFCKDYLNGKTCSGCAHGTYQSNSTGSIECLACDCGASLTTAAGCSAVGQCQCRPGFTGRQCDQVIEGAFLPGPRFVRAEFEYSNVSVKGSRQDELPGYSGEGYGVFENEMQATVLVAGGDGVKFLLARYATNASNPRLLITLQDSSGHTEQEELILHRHLNIGVSSRILRLLSSGEVSVTVYAHDLEPGEKLLLDYISIIPFWLRSADPQEFDVPEYCSADTPADRFCQRRVFNDAFSFVTRAVGSAVPGVLAGRDVAAITPSTHAEFPLSDDRKGKRFVLVIEYFTAASAPLELNVTIRNEIGTIIDTTGTIQIHECQYVFGCRQVLGMNGYPSMASLPLTGQLTAQLSVLQTDTLPAVYVASVILIGENDWSVELLKSEVLCIRYQGDCLPPVPPPISQFSTTVDLIDASPSVIPDAMGRSQPLAFVGDESDYALVSSEGAVVTISLPFSTGDLYSVMLHYRLHSVYGGNPFLVNITVGPTTSTYVIPFCPSHTGCLVGKEGFLFPITPDITSLTITPIPTGSVLIKAIVFVEEISQPTQGLDVAVPQVDKRLEFDDQCINEEYSFSTSSDLCRRGSISHRVQVYREPQDCGCDADGSLNSTSCASVSGQCSCKPGVTGRQCDRCKLVHFGFPNCQPCNCVDGGECHPTLGQCTCPVNTITRTCRQCVAATWSTDLTQGCQACNCSTSGSQSQSCNASTGACPCLLGYGGQTCNECADEYTGHPACRACNCAAGSGHNVCSKTTGDCVCKARVRGPLCDVCMDGYFNLVESNAEGCTDCACDAVGTVESMPCDKTSGQCVCKSNVTGTTCDECEEFTYRLETGECGPCTCDVVGSVTQQCDVNTAHCDCKPHVVGDHCDRCAPGFWNLAENGCQPCNCTEKWSVDGTCDQTTGDCLCKQAVVGQFCQACQARHVPNGEEGCVACDECTDSLFDEITVMRAMLLEVTNDSSYFDALAAARTQLDNLTDAARRNNMRRSTLQSFVIAAYSLLGYDVTPRMDDIMAGPGVDVSGSGFGLSGSGMESDMPTRDNFTQDNSAASKLDELSSLVSNQLVAKVLDLASVAASLQREVDETDEVHRSTVDHATDVLRRADRLIERLYFAITMLIRTNVRHGQDLSSARKMQEEIRLNSDEISESLEEINEARELVTELNTISVREQGRNDNHTVAIRTSQDEVRSLATLVEALRNATQGTRRITGRAQRRIDNARASHDRSSQLVVNASEQLQAILADVQQLAVIISGSLESVANATSDVDATNDAIEAIRAATESLVRIVEKSQNDSTFIQTELTSIKTSLNRLIQDLDSSETAFETVVTTGNRSAAAATAYRDITQLIASALSNASDALQAANTTLRLARNQTLQGMPERARMANEASEAIEQLLEELTRRFEDSASQLAMIASLLEAEQGVHNSTVDRHTSGLERQTEVANSDPSSRITPMQDGADGINETILMSDRSIRNTEENITRLGEHSDRIQRDLNTIDRSNNHVKDVLDGLDTEPTENTIRDSDTNIVDLKGRAKAIMNRLAGMQEKISWAQSKLANFPGAVKLSTAEESQETGSALELSLSSDVRESYAPYTAVRFSMNAEAKQGSTLADGLLFYLGPVMEEPADAMAEGEAQQDWIDSIRVFANAGTLGATVRGGYPHETSTVSFSLVQPNGQLFQLSAGQWYQINITRLGNWDIRADVGIPLTSSTSTMLTDTQPLTNVANEKFDLRRARFFLGGLLDSVVDKLPSATGTPVHSVAGCYNEVFINSQPMGVWNASTSAFSKSGGTTPEEHTCQSCISSGADYCRRSRSGSLSPATLNTDGGSYVNIQNILTRGGQNAVRMPFKTPTEDGLIASFCAESSNDSIVIFLENGQLNFHVVKDREVVWLQTISRVNRDTNVKLHFSDNVRYVLQLRQQINPQNGLPLVVFQISQGAEFPVTNIYRGGVDTPRSFYLGGLPLGAPDYCRSGHGIGGFKGCLSDPVVNAGPLNLAVNPVDRIYSGVSFDRCAKNTQAFRPCAQLDGEFLTAGGAQTTAFLLFRQIGERPGFLHYFTSRVRIAFNVKTNQRDVVLLFATQDGQRISSGQIDTFLHLSLASGQLIVEMSGLDAGGIDRFRASSTARFDDDELHQVLLTHDIYTDGNGEYSLLNILVDHQQVIGTRLTGLRRNWMNSVNSFLAIGGIPRSIGSRVRISPQFSLKGCVCDLTINDRIFNFADAFQKNSLVSYTSCKVRDILRRIPAPLPVATAGPPTTPPPNCPAVTAEYDSDCLGFSPSSLYSYDINSRSLLRTGMDITFRFRTRLDNTVLLYASSANGYRFFSLSILNGRLHFHIDSSGSVDLDESIITPPAGVSYTDGQWHTARIERRGSVYRVEADRTTENAVSENGETRRSTLPLDGQVYFGSLPENPVENRLAGSGLRKFVGSLDDITFVMNNGDNFLTPERLVSKTNVIDGCYENMANVERPAHGYPMEPGVLAYTQLHGLSGYNVSSELNVQLELSTRQGFGALFSWHAVTGAHLLLSLVDGQVHLAFLTAGSTDASTVTHPLPVCTGKFYNVGIKVTATELELTVGEVNGQSTMQSASWQAPAALNMQTTAFIGYVDPGQADAGTYTAFNGCLRDVDVGTTRYSPAAPSATTTQTNVNQGSCHILE